MKVEHVITRSPDETQELARGLLTRLPPARAVLALDGDLGSGKTCFVQGLARALGVRQPVTSPTFVMVNEYPGGSRPLYHIDLYRLRTPDETLGLGLEEYLDAPGVTVIEWAERAGDLVPADAIRIRFARRGNPDEREISISWPDRSGDSR